MIIVLLSETLILRMYASMYVYASSIITTIILIVHIMYIHFYKLTHINAFVYTFSELSI